MRATLWLALIALPTAASAGKQRPYYAGYQLPEAEGLYERWDPRRSWGAKHMVDALQEVANRVAFQLPLADPVFIGDISRRGGGRLEGHTTHHLGIDVDIGLFMGDGRQPLGGFVDLAPHELDVRSTWILLTALLDTGQVKFILLDRGHIDVLRKYALKEVGLDAATVDELFPPAGTWIPWRRRGVVRHAPNHSSHMHIRLSSQRFEDRYDISEDDPFGNEGGEVMGD